MEDAEIIIKEMVFLLMLLYAFLTFQLIEIKNKLDQLIATKEEDAV